LLEWKDVSTEWGGRVGGVGGEFKNAKEGEEGDKGEGRKVKVKE